MKILKQPMFVAIVLVIASGCDSLLDLEPSQSISNATAYETSEAVQTALIGAYDGLSDDDLYGGSYIYFADLVGQDGDVFWSGTFEQPEEAFQKNFTTENSFVSQAWTESYDAINRTNNILANLGVVDDSDRDRIEGEAKFIRGTIYFELARVFGKAWNDGDPSANLAVPLIIDPTDAITEESFVSRASVQAIYQQAISDLTDAQNLLEPLGTDNGFFANTYAASAILSRVYRQQGNWTGARDEASRVIESGNYSLVANYVGAFANSVNTNEDIFAIQVTGQDGANDMNTFYAPSEDGGRGDVDILQVHLDKYEAGDERLDQFYQDGNGVVRTSKWQNSVDGNISVARLAEMYLTRAEANLILGETVGDTPANDLNTVRGRVGLPPNLAPTVDDVRDERFLELAFEGHFLHELKLREGTITGNDADPNNDISWDANELVYPVPQRERDANPNLSQNPGYGDG